VAHALGGGRRVSALPITPERVLAAVAERDPP
jgi:CO/xanthine dehydrogenase Mo-binding subunit